MRPICKYLHCLVLLAFAVQPAQADGDGIIFMHNDLSPYVVYRDGKISGFLYEHLNKVTNAGGVSPIWQNVPWERQIPILRQNQPNICAVALYRTAAREKYISYSDAIGVDRGFAVISAHQNDYLLAHKSLSSVIADPDLTPVLQVETTYGAYINGLLEGRNSIVTAASTERLLRTMHHNPKTYAILPAFLATSHLDKFKLKDSLTIYRHFTDIQGDAPYYLGCTKSTNKTLLQKINKAIKIHGMANPG